MLQHLFLDLIPEIVRGHTVDPCISQDGKFFILYGQVKENPVALFGFMHLQFPEPPRSPVHYILFAAVVDVHPDLPDVLVSALFYGLHDLLFLLFGEKVCSYHISL